MRMTKEEYLETYRSLVDLLVHTYSVYLETQVAHWNISGANFFGIHKMTQEHYEEMAEAIDRIAEHIRTMGFRVPVPVPKSPESTNRDVDYKILLRRLLASHRAVLNICTHCQELPLEPDTDNLIADRMEAHNKMSWMLESTVNEKW